ncbi:MAG: glycosyltransferase family 4 protein [bacterium]|nr:glycosyltransferase family 4 protein [bacterium]
MADVCRARVLFLIPEDWVVCSHRLPLLRAAVAAGHEVFIATRVVDHAGPILETGAELIPLGFRRGFRGPRHELAGLRELIRIYRRVRPDLVHHVTPKSVIFGTLAARMTRVPCIVNAMTGLGFVFTSGSVLAHLMSAPIALMLRVLLRGPGSSLIVQNADDVVFFRDRLGVPAGNVVLIRGAGVNVRDFTPAASEPDGTLRVVLMARMLADKGINEVVAAARLLRARRTDVRILLAGRIDIENPAGIAPPQLAAWSDEGVVDVLGHVDDTAGLLRSCHVALLPSYREGLPKSLLEAAACGLPIVAADVPGCREICIDGVNGILVPARQAEPIAAAIGRLVDDPALAAPWGRPRVVWLSRSSPRKSSPKLRCRYTRTCSGNGPKNAAPISSAESAPGPPGPFAVGSTFRLSAPGIMR